MATTRKDPAEVGSLITLPRSDVANIEFGESHVEHKLAESQTDHGGFVS